MRFEEQKIADHAEAVTFRELKEGAIYFFVEYVDSELLIPTVSTVVFIGQNLEPGDVELVYFQDVESHRAGVRYASAMKNGEASFYQGSQHELGHVFEYQKALEELMRCSVRRGNRS